MRGIVCFFRRAIQRPIIPFLILVVLVLLPVCSGDDGNPTTPDDGGPPPNTVDTIPPADVVGLAATTATASWIALQWQAPGDDGWTGSAAEYDLRFDTTSITDLTWDAAEAVAGEPVPGPGGGLEIHQVTGLDPATQYYFALKTRDEVPNESGLSNVATGTTLQEFVPPSPVLDLHAESVDDTTFSLTWTATGNNWTVGTAKTYDLRYSRNIIYPHNFQGADQVPDEPDPKPAGEPESLLVTVPVARSNYFFAMKVADAVPNWSDLSNVSFGLGHGIYLWGDRAVVHKGENLTFTYRAHDNSTVKIELFSWNPPNNSDDCGKGMIMVMARSHEQGGVYTNAYDCINPHTGEYIYTVQYYASICIDDIFMGLFRFEFTD